ncbi:hypothetical protein [Citricoccus sp. SGAir0253]|nr:hypothetical protein [Citricoccus sp. SGAir0253]
MTQHTPHLRYRSRYARNGSATTGLQVAAIALVVCVLGVLAMVLLSNP